MHFDLLVHCLDSRLYACWKLLGRTPELYSHGMKLQNISPRRRPEMSLGCGCRDHGRSRCRAFLNKTVRSPRMPCCMVTNFDLRDLVLLYAKEPALPG